MSESIDRGAEAWAIRPCLYGGKRLERGERFRLAGLATDGRLIEAHYVQLVQAKHSRYECSKCDRVFVGGENYALHLTNTHQLSAEEAKRAVGS